MTAHAKIPRRTFVGAKLGPQAAVALTAFSDRLGCSKAEAIRILIAFALQELGHEHDEEPEWLEDRAIKLLGNGASQPSWIKL